MGEASVAQTNARREAIRRGIGRRILESECWDCYECRERFLEDEIAYEAVELTYTTAGLFILLGCSHGIESRSTV